MSEDTIRIVLVEDHKVVREGLRRLIETSEGLIVCGEADSANDGLAEIDREKPDVAIVDLSPRGIQRPRPG